jgi:hypothetical protein
VTRSQDLECVQSGCREQLQEPQIAYLSNAHGAFEEVLSQETVRRWMRDAGLWIPRKQRPPRIHQPSNRRACLGELIQIDGSDHAWFEERAPACMLLVYVDDSTSRLMALHFTASESTFRYFETTRAYLERYGKPVAFYSDRASVFRPTHSRSGARGVTQFGRATFTVPSVPALLITDSHIDRNSFQFCRPLTAM